MQFTWCTQIAKGTISPNNGKIHEIMDFEPFYYTHISPSFYSKSVKQHVFTVFQNEFYTKYYNENDTLPTSGGNTIINETTIITTPCDSERICVKSILAHAADRANDFHFNLTTHDDGDHQYKPGYTSFWFWIAHFFRCFSY